MLRADFTVTLSLAAWLHEDMRAPKSFQLNGGPDAFLAKGCLSLAAGVARCSVAVQCDWPERPPRFVCHEPWLKHGADWHAYGDGSLCYVFEKEWCDKIAGLFAARGEFVAARVARFWLLRNARWLLNKHLLADQLGLRDWQHKEWQYYSHGYQVALREYLRAGNRRRSRGPNR
jgi:hypothetical protein